MEDLRIYIDKIKQICVEKKVIILLLLILFLSIIGLYCLFSNNNDNADLYQVNDYENSETIFIDNCGNEYLKIKEEDSHSKLTFINKDNLKTSEFVLKDKYINIGEYTGDMIFAYTIDSDKYVDYYSYFEDKNCETKLGTLYMFNKNGTLIKKFDDKFVYIFNYDKDENCYIPFFYKGYARIAYTDKTKITKLSDIKYKYINKKGEVVKNVPQNIKQILDNGYNKGRLERKSYMSIYEDINENTYIDSHNNVIWTSLKPIFIYDIKNNRWIEYDKRLGNKYINNCVYLYQKDLAPMFINQNFELMYNEHEQKLLLDKISLFNIYNCKIINNRLFYFEPIYSLKLYELKYQQTNKKINFVEVTDKKIIEEVLKGLN